MKNTLKIVSVLLSVMILVCGIAAVSSAEDSPSVEIVSKNLSYDSNISILFAVKTANTEIAPKLNIYNMVDGELTYNKTVEATFTPANSLAEVGFADAYIFFTPGIVAKAIDTEIYVEAVVTDGETEYKSAVERYSIVEYCHEMNAQKSTDMYTEIIEYGATVQKMLEADGKFEGAYATDYKYVTIEGGTLDGTYDSGIYLKGESVYPQAEGVTAWAGSDGSTVTNANEYVIGDSNVSFTETTGDVEIVPTGTLTFEGSTDLPAEIGKSLNSSGSSVSVVSTERDGAATNALKFSTKSGGQDTITLKPTVTEENYDTVAFEFDVNLGTSGGYEMFIRDTKGTQIFKFGVEYGSKWQIKDLTNTSAGYNFWSVNAADANTWVHIRIEITPDPITKMDKLSITYNDTSVNMAVSDKRYHTVGEIFYTADQIAQLDLRSWSSTANDIYFDNVLVEKIATNARPVGTNDIESGSHPSNMSQGKSELITDTVYGESSKVLHLKPDSDGTAETYNVYANNTIVDAANAQGLGFAADLKFVKDPNGDNAAYDFMLDGYLDGATSTSAVYWLRFISSDGKVYIQNQKNTSEKFEIGVLGEYFYFEAAYVVENGVSMVHIMSNGNYVGSFVTQQNTGSAPIDKISNLRIRTMSNYTSDMYIDNMFVGFCYIPDVQ